MTVLASDRADSWGFNPTNFLQAYCNANNVAPAGYYVEEKEDGVTGQRFFYLHPSSDGAAGASDTDAATPQVIDFATGDAEAVAECSVNA